MKKSQIFQEVPIRKPKRNFFDLSHEVKLSGKIGKLIPIMLIDAVPGDIFTDSSEIMLRFMPMPAPVMHRFDVTTHTFAIPYRLLMEQSEWEDFITGGPDGTAEPVLPYFTPAQIETEGLGALMQNSTLWDYMGLPRATLNGGLPANQISSLPFRAYQLIYNEYYRDQNLITEVEIPQNMGIELDANLENLLTLRNRAWEKDYATSALPWTQRGAEVALPLEINYLDQSELYHSDGSAWTPGAGLADGGGTGLIDEIAMEAGRVENIDQDSLLVTINELRRTVRLQEWLEANARGGARYTEQIYVHFGERVPDYRLQRPEYLGGGKQPVVISEVLASASSAEADNNEVGDMAGHGLSVGRSNRWSYKCVEHMFIMTIMSVTPRSCYQQGVPKRFLRRNKFDFFWKEFANIGEQPILNMEVYFRHQVAEQANNEATFGYTPRYAEYKYEQDRVHGAFRSSLSYWHDGRIFSSPPTLSEEFIEIDVEGQGLNRIFYVTAAGNDHLLVQIFHHLKARRPMPYFGVPSL